MARLSNRELRRLNKLLKPLNERVCGCGFRGEMTPKNFQYVNGKPTCCLPCNRLRASRGARRRYQIPEQRAAKLAQNKAWYQAHREERLIWQRAYHRRQARQAKITRIETLRILFKRKDAA